MTQLFQMTQLFSNKNFSTNKLFAKFIVMVFTIFATNLINNDVFVKRYLLVSQN